MVVVLSLARTLPKSTDLPRTSAVRWPSLLSLFVETYGSETCKLDADDITNVLKVEFDCRPGALAISLALREPKYQVTAAYCHFGRTPYTKDG